MTNTHRIALVEDEPLQRQLLTGLLESGGFEVSAYADTLALRRDLAVPRFDLFLLDWELPNESGLELLRWLRTSGVQTPVIFLTATGDESRVVDALDVGADDYLLKPPRAGELAARIRAVIRRVSGDRRVLGTLSCPPYLLDLKRGQLMLHGEPVELTRREFELATYFFRHEGQPVSRDALMIQVWNTNPNVTTRSIDTFVSRLRKKLGLDGTHGWKLEAVYQRGYRMVNCSGDEAAPAGGIVAS